MAEDRRRAALVALVLLALVAAFVIFAVDWNEKSRGSGDSSHYGLDKAACMALFDARMGHDPSDGPFWAGLIDCANKGLLPPGQNDPGFYSADQ